MPTAIPCAPLASRLESRRQHDRLFRLTIVIGAEFDTVLVDTIEQEPRDLGHARFGVAIGGRVIAVDVAEIALAVDQRVAGGKILRQPYHRIVDRLVAMGMERAHHVADDLGDFLNPEPGSSRNSRMP